MPTGADIIASMQKYADTPYSQGPQIGHVGLDCSGIVQLGLKDLGISISRTTVSQLADANSGKMGVNIGTDLSKAQPGDIIHYNGHEEVYTGNGMEWGEHTWGKPAGPDKAGFEPIIGIVRYTADPGTPGAAPATGGDSSDASGGALSGITTLLTSKGTKLGLIVFGGLVMIVALLATFNGGSVRGAVRTLTKVA